MKIQRLRWYPKTGVQLDVFLIERCLYIQYRLFGQLGRCGYGMQIQIDKNAPVPLYRQAVAEVRRLIDAGLLATAIRLPTSRVLRNKAAVRNINETENILTCIDFSGS
jgi:hypothetical protein